MIPSLTDEESVHMDSSENYLGIVHVAPSGEKPISVPYKEEDNSGARAYSVGRGQMGKRQNAKHQAAMGVILYFRFKVKLEII